MFNPHHLVGAISPLKDGEIGTWKFGNWWKQGSGQEPTNLTIILCHSVVWMLEGGHGKT